MASIDELEQELGETEASIEGLRASLEENRAKDLTKIITPTGKMAGDITGLTPRQYEEFVGRRPNPTLLRKLEGQTTEKIPWNLVLDQLASERGYDSDEALKDAIEAAKADTKELEDLKHNRDALIDTIKDKVQEGILDVDTIKVTRESDLPNGMLKGEVTEVDGSEIGAYRQHSFWTIEVDLDNDGVVDHKFRIRYAKEARKIIAMAVKDLAEKKMAELEPRRRVKYRAKRRPKVKRYRSNPTSIISPRW